MGWRSCPKNVRFIHVIGRRRTSISHFPTVPEDVLRVAREVELAAFNKYQPETSEPYKTRIRTLYQNLKNKSNLQLRLRVLNGEITAARFVVMTHDELKSAERKKEDEAIMKENMRVAMAAQELKAISSQLKCTKCGQKKVSYSQAQTRSADEPMTTFCECTVCGNRWKVCHNLKPLCEISLIALVLLSSRLVQKYFRFSRTFMDGLGFMVSEI